MSFRCFFVITIIVSGEKTIFAYMDNQLFSDLPQLHIVPEKSNIRRRYRTVSVVDTGITCRSERIARRNRLLVARYYYWTEIKRRRFDDVVKILSDCEFFVEERTISNALLDNDTYLNELITAQKSMKALKSEYPGFDWD